MRSTWLGGAVLRRWRSPSPAGGDDAQHGGGAPGHVDPRHDHGGSDDADVVQPDRSDDRRHLVRSAGRLSGGHHRRQPRRRLQVLHEVHDRPRVLVQSLVRSGLARRRGRRRRLLARQRARRALRPRHHDADGLRQRLLRAAHRLRQRRCRAQVPLLQLQVHDAGGLPGADHLPAADGRPRATSSATSAPTTRDPTATRRSRGSTCGAGDVCKTGQLCAGTCVDAVRRTGRHLRHGHMRSLRPDAATGKIIGYACQ